MFLHHSEKVNNKHDNIAAIVGGTVSVSVGCNCTHSYFTSYCEISIPFHYTCTESKSGENKRGENYSELLVSRRPEDQHTPNINLSSSLQSDQQNKVVSNTNYVNVQSITIIKTGESRNTNNAS